MGKSRATKYTPATTMVAACIKAETGVGPSMASGNQMCNGNMADFPAPPMKMRSIAQVVTDKPMNTAPDVCAMTGPSKLVSVIKSNVLVLKERIRIPTKNPKSAKRVTMNAFLEAATADG